MKINMLFFSFFLMLSITVMGQSPKMFNFQALANPNGNPIIEKNIQVKASILEGGHSGVVAYQELIDSETDDQGFFNVQIGSGATISGVFAQVKWENGVFFIKVEVSEDNGSTFQLLGVTQLLSVPYAFYADKSESLSNIHFYSSSSEMSFDQTLTEGEIVKTLGFYEAGDGGNATYKITTNGGAGTIGLENGLKASLVVEKSTVDVKQFGAMPNNGNVYGLLSEALEFSSNNNYTLFFPNGTYNIDQTLTIAGTNINSSLADKPVTIKGESAYGVMINMLDSQTTSIDFSRSKQVNIENISSNTLIKLVEYGEEFIPLSQKREVFAKNVYTNTLTEEDINWGLLINTPKPAQYADNSGGAYARYPVEIINNSGYNALMINNFAVNEAGDVESPVDNSAIGIIDKVKNNAGSFLIEGGYRPFLVFKNENSSLKSSVIEGSVFSISPEGKIGINASHYYSDEQAPGTYTMKIRDNRPSIALYDATENNKSVQLSYAGKYFTISDSQGDVLMKLGTHANVFEQLGSGGFATSLIIRDAAYNRGLRFWRLPSSPNGEKHRIIYTDSNNYLRTYPWASAPEDESGELLLTNKNGYSNQRPNLDDSENVIGFMFFDRTLNIPIWWNGSKWVDASGNER
ncbi:hypothetical protein R9C00_23660 [Flammeovirgaceae bacterium SG7u.111]|nr:hypothetical protein [Flammeovirgaceae bacterium SG7u.132]WPO34702.1 hypothetical protein R9C00_23660 [Flammeovirgaceae bacterium SG7u.111]